MAQKRKIIQISAAAKSGFERKIGGGVAYPKTHLFALCNDGSLFELCPDKPNGPSVWHRVPEIPESL